MDFLYFVLIVIFAPVVLFYHFGKFIVEAGKNCMAGVALYPLILATVVWGVAVAAISIALEWFDSQALFAFLVILVFSLCLGSCQAKIQRPPTMTIDEKVEWPCGDCMRDADPAKSEQEAQPEPSEPGDEKLFTGDMSKDMLTMSLLLAIKGDSDIPIEDATDFQQGATHIPFEVTEARRLGQKVEYLPWEKKWRMPDGRLIE